MGCEDLNETAGIQETGVLFMEGEAEPFEITWLKRDLGSLADDFFETGKWLAEAMQSSWEIAQFLIPNPALASVLGERHRIIANDWLAASMSSLISHLVRRAIDVLKTIDVLPAAVRADIAGPWQYPDYLYSTSELLDRAADLSSESAILVHENERRCPVFRTKVQEAAGKTAEINTTSNTIFATLPLRKWLLSIIKVLGKD